MEAIIPFEVNHSIAFLAISVALSANLALIPVLRYKSSGV